MKLYLLSVIEPAGDGLPDPEFLKGVRRDLDVINRDMRAAGAWVFAAGLHPPSTATVVRHREGRTMVTDGPFAEGKEHVGGFTVIEVADLDDALAWADRLSEATTLPIEVRPFRGQT